MKKLVLLTLTYMFIWSACAPVKNGYIDSEKVTETINENLPTSALPVPITDLTAGKSTYKITTEVQGKTLQKYLIQTIEERDGNWVITQSTKTMMWDVEDETTLKKGTLEPITRTSNQGMRTISLSYKSDEIIGVVNVNGNEQAIDVSIDEPVFADGAALYETLARLPLKEGYKAVFRTFDMQKQRIKTYELNVVAKETVEVPAGKFETYKTTLKELGDTPGDAIMWFSAEKDQLGLIKITATLPEMSGAKVTMEMSKQ